MWSLNWQSGRKVVNPDFNKSGQWEHVSYHYIYLFRKIIERAVEFEEAEAIHLALYNLMSAASQIDKEKLLYEIYLQADSIPKSFKGDPVTYKEFLNKIHKRIKTIERGKESTPLARPAD